MAAQVVSNATLSSIVQRRIQPVLHAICQSLSRVDIHSLSDAAAADTPLEPVYFGYSPDVCQSSRLVQPAVYTDPYTTDPSL
jgi:hypothetical protein